MDYLTHVSVIGLIYFLAAAGTNIFVGHLALTTLGHGAVVATGAYTYALLTLNGLSPWLAFGAALLTGSLLAALFGAAALRTSDEAFALITFGFHVFLVAVLLNASWLTNGALGLARIPSLPVPGAQRGVHSTLLVSISVVAALLAITALARRAGALRTLHAIRDDAGLARSLGIAVGRWVVGSCASGGAITGAAGALMAQYLSFIDPYTFPVYESVTLLTIVLIGGPGRLMGVGTGVLVIVLLPEGLRFLGGSPAAVANARQLLVGIALLASLALLPKGVLGSAGLRRVFHGR